jgi:hypothetical protein
MDDLLDEIRNYLAVQVYAGFASEQEITARAMYDWESSWEEAGQPAAELRPFLERTTGELLEEHRQEQANWPEVTDCDRLDAAFAELERMGILARQNYEQTLTSGCAAIEAEAERQQASQPVIGYVFFHEQDTESAVCYDGPALAWGAFDDDDEAWRRVARTILEVLKRHGISAEWRGEFNSRIIVNGMTWQRRR